MDIAVRYRSIIADVGHRPIKTWADMLKSVWPVTVGLYLDGALIGTGELSSLGRRNVHTDDMRLIPEYRRKGHGIHLYLAVIDAAKRLGAKTVYSSWSLNKKSRRMWKEKLKEYYTVHRQGGCSACGHGGRFFIKLEGE